MELFEKLRIEIQTVRHPGGMSAVRRQRERVIASSCDGDTSGAMGSSPDDAAFDWYGRSRTARLAMINKPLRC
jgi:hypothetical protein